MRTLSLSPVARRVVYALLFEAIGLVITTLGLLAFSGKDTATAGGAALGSMIIRWPSTMSSTGASRPGSGGRA